MRGERKLQQCSSGLRFCSNPGVNELSHYTHNVAQPQKLADAVFEAICKDVEEKALEKAKHAFRDKVFENCTKQQVS